MKMQTIHIFINGIKKNINSETQLELLLNSLDIDAETIAVEVNKEVIPKSKYKMIKLKKNDEIEIVQCIGGG